MTLILSGTNGLSDVDGDASTPAIRGTDANTGIFFGTDIIGFSEGGTEAMRINADAQIVAAAGTASLPVITTTGDVNTGIFFPAADTIAFAEGGTECGRFNSSGNLQTIGTISVGNATPSTSGAGITFPATQSASSNANTLDDYEEGTWTPVAAVSGFTTAIDTLLGTYTKIGRSVTVAMVVILSSSGRPTTYSEFSGLPFTVGSAGIGPYIGSDVGTGLMSSNVECFASSMFWDRTTGSSNSAVWKATATYFV
jgi:hypothetical protein